MRNDPKTVMCLLMVCFLQNRKSEERQMFLTYMYFIRVAALWTLDISDM